jgi:hypothetical protein
MRIRIWFRIQPITLMRIRIFNWCGSGSRIPKWSDPDFYLMRTRTFIWYGSGFRLPKWCGIHADPDAQHWIGGNPPDLDLALSGSMQSTVSMRPDMLFCWIRQNRRSPSSTTSTQQCSISSCSSSQTIIKWNFNLMDHSSTRRVSDSGPIYVIKIPRPVHCLVWWSWVASITDSFYVDPFVQYRCDKLPSPFLLP